MVLTNLLFKQTFSSLSLLSLQGTLDSMQDFLKTTSGSDIYFLMKLLLLLFSISVHDVNKRIAFFVLYLVTCTRIV